MKEDSDELKARIFDTVQSGDVMPKYVAVDVKKQAKYFELQYPKFDMVVLEEED